MEIIKVQLARAIWLFDTQELNPLGINLFPDVFGAFSKRYEFAILPKPEEFLSGASTCFKQGRFFYTPQNVWVDIEFELHGDGIVANSRHSTEVSDAFLQDVLNWLGEQLGATYSASLSKKRIYRDELIVKMNLELGKAGSRFSKLSEILTSMTNKPTGIIGLTFGSEGSNNLSLVVERRANTPFEENRYFSVSGLQTAKHIEALVSFEQIMSDG